jgi:hypothetical protein
MNMWVLKLLVFVPHLLRRVAGRVYVRNSRTFLHNVALASQHDTKSMGVGFRDLSCGID